MPIRAQKTDALLPVKIHSEYRRIVEAVPNGENKVISKPAG